MNNNRRMSLKAYMAFDLAVFTILMCVFEFVTYKVTKMLNGKNTFYLNISVLIAVIGMIRWDWKSLFMLPLAGVIKCIVAGAEGTTYIIYLIGNLFIGLNLIWFIKGKKKIYNNRWFLVLFFITAYLFSILGQSLISIFFGRSFIDVFIGLFGTNLLSIFICSVIVFIVGKQKAIFVDQIDYLRQLAEDERIKEEQNKEVYDE